jgi:lysozyme family protein
MNPLSLILAMLSQQGGIVGGLVPPKGEPVPVPSPDQGTLIAALVTALAARQQANQATAQDLPRTGNIIAGVVAVGFLMTLAGIVMLPLLWSRHDGAFFSAFAALCMGFGVLASKFGTVIDYLFGASWGSRLPPSDAGPIFIPPAPKPLPPPEPKEPVETKPSVEPSVEDEPTEPAVDNFPRAHEVIAKWEGGYSDHPSDPGGATNYGITIGVLSEWRGRPVSKDEVKALTYSEALRIFRARYWEPLRCSAMPAPIALMTYNTGVNSGIKRGAEFLQECLNKQGAGLEVDREIGELTLAAVSKADATQLIQDYAARYESFYRSLGTFPTFGKGWLNRLANVKSTALSWAIKTPSQTPSEDRPTGADIVAMARRHIGEDYANIVVPKDDPNYTGPFDCAEFASYLVYQLTGRLYGCVDNNAAPAKADAYTGAWKRDAFALGRIVTVEEAAQTPGAFVLRYPASSSTMGHIVVSDGKGGTVEAKSTKAGLVAGKVSGRRWDIGVLIPWIDYSPAIPIDVAAPQVIYAIGQSNMSAGKITEIQRALTEKGYSPGELDGDFGHSTEAAVVEFQRAHGLVVDGEAGPETAAELGISLTA